MVQDHVLSVTALNAPVQGVFSHSGIFCDQIGSSCQIKCFHRWYFLIKHTINTIPILALKHLQSYTQSKYTKFYSKKSTYMITIISKQKP